MQSKLHNFQQSLACQGKTAKRGEYLKLFCNKVKKYYEEGIDWIHPTTEEICNSRIRVYFNCADAPARAALLNNKQYNRINGCETCKVQTNPLVIGKKKKGKDIKIRVYLPGKDTLLLRDDNRRQAQSKELHDIQQTNAKIDSVKGIIGESILSILPNFTSISCLAEELDSEYMYRCCVCIRISTNKSTGRPISSKNKMADIDKIFRI